MPDLLDEVKWELDWLLKMQDDDGGFFNRVAGRSFDNGQARPAAIRSRGSIPPRPRGRRPTPRPAWPTPPGFIPFRQRLSWLRRPASRRRTRGWAYLEAHPEMDPSDGTDGDSKLAATPASTMPTPIAAPASMPPPNCTRRSQSRA